MDLNTHEKNLIPLWICVEIAICNKKERNEYRKKEELIADTYTNLSHDIRTPLTSLDGYFQLIEECDNIDGKEKYG